MWFDAYILPLCGIVLAFGWSFLYCLRQVGRNDEVFLFDRMHLIDFDQNCSSEEDGNTRTNLNFIQGLRLPLFAECLRRGKKMHLWLGLLGTVHDFQVFPTY